MAAIKHFLEGKGAEKGLRWEQGRREGGRGKEGEIGREGQGRRREGRKGRERGRGRGEESGE